MNPVARFERVLETAKHHDPRPAAEERTARGGIEGPAVTVGGEDFAFAIGVAPPRRQRDAHPAGERQIALGAQEALTGQVRRDERCRASGLDVDARPIQIEEIGHAGGEKVLVVAGVPQQKEADVVAELVVEQQVLREVEAVPAAGEDADGTVETTRHVGGILEGFPRHLEKVTVLRIENRCVEGIEAEELGIEHLHAGHEHAPLDVVVGSALLSGHAGSFEIVVAQHRQRLDATDQVVPELVDVARTGSSRGVADDGDGTIGDVVATQRFPFRRRSRMAARRAAAALRASARPSLLSVTALPASSPFER